MCRAMSTALGLLLALIVASPCCAGFILQLGQSGTVGNNTFAGSPGDTVVMQIYLTQTDGETRLSSSSTALVSADFHLTIDGSLVSPVATSFGPGLKDDTSGKTGFTLSDARIAEIAKEQTGHVGVTTSADGVSDNSVLLGTVSFLIAPGASGIYNLSAARDTSSPLGSFALADPDYPQRIDVSSGFGTLEVSSTPEPSSLVLSAIGIAAVAYRSCKQRRKRRTR